jgi:hypothetical protein
MQGWASGLDSGTIPPATARTHEEDTMEGKLGPQEEEQRTGTGTAEGEDTSTETAGELREEDVTREDALDDSVPEGEGLQG